MRIIRLAQCIMLIGLASGSLAWAGGGSLVTVRTVGNVSPDLAKRVTGWVATNVEPATNAGPLLVEAKTLDAIALSLVSSSNMCPPVLVLVEKLEGDARRALVMKGLVLLNVGAMKPADLTTDAAREKFARRVEKEAVGGVAVSLGMSACPLLH